MILVDAFIEILWLRVSLILIPGSSYRYVVLYLEILERLAIGTIAWGSLSSVEDFVKVARFIRDTGFHGVGIEYRMLPGDLKRRPELLREILEDVGLDNVGSYSAIKMPSIEWARGSGTKLFWVVSRERDCSRADEELRTFARRTSAEGIVVALHNHLRTCYEDLEDLSRILDRVDSLMLCLDTAHAYAAGLDIGETLKRYSRRLALVHIKDLRARVAKSVVRFRRDFVNIGYGVIDFRSIIEMLDSSGYRGYLMLEIEALEGRSPFEAARDSIERIRRILL